MLTDPAPGRKWQYPRILPTPLPPDGEQSPGLGTLATAAQTGRILYQLGKGNSSTIVGYTHTHTLLLFLLVKYFIFIRIFKYISVGYKLIFFNVPMV